MLKLLDPPLLDRIYFTTPEHKNIYITQHCGGLFSFLGVRILEAHFRGHLYPELSCGILDTKFCVLLSGCCWCVATFPDYHCSTNSSVLRLQAQHPRVVFSLLTLSHSKKVTVRLSDLTHLSEVRIVRLPEGSILSIGQSYIFLFLFIKSTQLSRLLQ